MIEHIIEHIVVPLDGSKYAARALSPARSLAQAAGASVRLVTTHWKDGEGGAAAYLQDQADALDLPHVEALVIRDRTPEEAILLEARQDHSVICMATHGRGGLVQALLGGVADAVLRAATVPVMLIGGDVDERWSVTPGELLVPFDGSQTAAAIAPIASEWAQLLDLAPHAFQVLPAGRAIAEKPPGAESADIRRFATDLEADGTRRAPVLWDMPHALDPAAAIVEHARSSPTVLVMMATHGRGGRNPLALGSVAGRVVHDSPCPVVVIRTPR